MPDPIAGRRLKKRMLDRWENEGGRIATDTTSADASKPTSEDRAHSKKPSPPSDNSTVGGGADSRKSVKPRR